MKPSVCRKCGESLHGQDPQPRRHQVAEIPPVQAEVTEYRLHRLTCTACRHPAQGDRVNRPMVCGERMGERWSLPGSSLPIIEAADSFEDLGDINEGRVYPSPLLVNGYQLG